MPRPHLGSGPGRLARGWGAALIATLVAAGSHTLAGPGHHDDAPSPLVFILTLALAGPLCTALAGRMLSWTRLSAGVLLSQGLFHGLYSLGPGAAPIQAGTAPGHEHHVQHLTVAAAEPLPVSEVGVSMAAAHLVAAVVTVMLLRQGEQAVLTAAEWVLLRRPVLTLVPVVLPSVFGQGRAAWHRPPILQPFRDVVTGLQWRGPPSWSLAP